MQTNCIFIAYNFVIYPHILIFSVFKIARELHTGILVANKIFRVTVLLLVSFWGQFVAPEIRHRRRHCRLQYLSTINMVCSDKYKILIKKHINTLRIQLYAYRN